MALSLPPHTKELLTGKTVYCGFSGGADSMMLLLLLHEAEEVFSFSLQVVHFEHGLRGSESLEDSGFARDFCRNRNIPFQLISLNVPENIGAGEGTEACARRLRLNHWKRLASDPQTSVVALGHHSGDLTENLLLRLMRGSNCSGASSLAEYTINDGVAFFRPLLNFSKQELTEELQGRGLEWRTDSSNIESDYGRNFLRNNVLPQIYEKFSYAEGGLLRSIQNLSSDADFIDRAGEEYYRKMDPECRHDWCGLHPALFCRVFRKFLSEKTGVPLYCGHQLISRFESMINHPPEQGFQKLIITDLPEYSLYVSRKTVILKHTIQLEPLNWNWKTEQKITFSDTVFCVQPVENMDIRAGDHTVFFDAESLPCPLLLRQICQGDKMIPFGKKSYVPVKSLLSEAHCPEPLRDFFSVLTDLSGEILWLPGIRRSAAFPVSDPDKKLIQIKSLPGINKTQS